MLGAAVLVRVGVGVTVNVGAGVPVDEGAGVKDAVAEMAVGKVVFVGRGVAVCVLVGPTLAVG